MKDLTDGIPIIKRARGYRLYDLRGNRIVDLFQNGGAALLGHRGIRLTHELKNVISRGLLFDLPSVYEPRLLRELGRRFPDFPDPHLFAHRGEALAYLGRFLGRELRWEDIAEPARNEEGPVIFHRPFLPRPPEGSAEAIVPLLPFRVGDSPVVVCTRGRPRDRRMQPRADVSVSPMLLAGALRSLHELNRFQVPEFYRRNVLRGIAGWAQRGPYVLPRFTESEYGAVFDRFLESGYLLSPSYRTPSILPGEASPGEWAKMIRLFRRYPGE